MQVRNENDYLKTYDLKYYARIKLLYSYINKFSNNNLVNVGKVRISILNGSVVSKI